MNICILKVDYHDSKQYSKLLPPPSDPTPYLSGHKYETFLLSKRSVDRQLNVIAIKGFDLFFNLCDGAKDEDIPGLEVVQFLERHNVAFTGAGSGFYEPSRLQMKEACRKVNISCPAGVLLSPGDNISEKTGSLNFPVIVKHPNSYNSIGLTLRSVVYNALGMNVEIMKMFRNFRGAFVEEYISGREFTALVAESPGYLSKPLVFNPMEIIFPEGEHFKHFNLKWKAHKSMKYDNDFSTMISENISSSASEMFLAMNGKGYARCDLRMNKDGKLFMLEINPNCSIYFPANDPASSDEILFSEPVGHQRFTDIILQTAIKRKTDSAI